MIKKSLHIRVRLVGTMLIALWAVCIPAHPAGAMDNSAESSAWDTVISNVLATGMYGMNTAPGENISMHLQRAENLYKGLAPDKAQLNGQNITFSYAGSSGLLGFSAGYIYTLDPQEQTDPSVFLGIDRMDHQEFDPFRSWYLALDLAKSYQVHDNFSLGVGSKTMLMKNPFDTNEGRIFSLLFNMPLSYKNYITITPELQWSRPLAETGSTENSALRDTVEAENLEDIFYGGVSVTFSY